MRVFIYDKSQIKDGYETIRMVCRLYALEEGEKDFPDPSVLKALESAKISRTASGKPYFPDIPELHFSVSHTGEVWACAVDRQPIGFDIEKTDRFSGHPEKDKPGKERKAEKLQEEKAVRKKWDSLAKRFFTNEEYEFVQKNGSLAFLRLWVRKEAYLKYKGCGLSGGLDRIEMVSGGIFVSAFSDCWIQEINIGAGLISAYCSEKKKNTVNISDNRISGHQSGPGE